MTTTTDSVPAPSTSAQASLYQRLRGHLAVLKLHDAAQALPSVLDRAQAEGTSMTAALEELLSIEVEATEARRPGRPVTVRLSAHPSLVGGLRLRRSPRSGPQAHH